MKKTKKRVIFRFFEDYLLYFSIVFFVVTITAGEVLAMWAQCSGIKNFLVYEMGSYLATEDNSLVTVATVFIGIYFTIYTMLTAIQSESVLANLKKADFKKILSILSVGFCSSFFYTLYSIFFKVSYNAQKEITSYLILLLALIFFISALQFGVLIALILRRDIYGAIESIEERRRQESERDQLYKKLESFLDKEQVKVDIEQAEQMAKHLMKNESRKKPPTK
ncbi:MULTISPECIES: hypothetical protein [Enterococcus]|uniref:hypothetical protein n=1 Tax=Enterococcus TaxID=1350 RepID=UPI002492FE63|nr:hypothetical protein [Enterococcus dispar]